jgi:protein-tyrosine phosphatase
MTPQSRGLLIYVLKLDSQAIFMTYKLLFVCLGNICRSPAAENIMNHLIEQAGLSEYITCDSAGTSSYHIGSPPDRRMTSTANNRGIPMKGRARQFQASDFDKFDLILAMDKENYLDILALDSQKKYRDKVKLMCDFATHHQIREVPDPYYGGREGFEKVLDLLLDACEGLLNYIRETNIDVNK